jgi:hypothetical protein
MDDAIEELVSIAGRVPPGARPLPPTMSTSRSFVWLFAALVAISALLVTRGENALDPPVATSPPSASSASHESVTNVLVIAPGDTATADIRKYDPLLESLPPHTRDSLKQRLIARETADPAKPTELAERERELSLLLDAERYALYERLRESVEEQAYLDAFARELGNVAALTAEQHRNLLLAKLRHKDATQELEWLIESRVDLEAMERSYATDIATQGVRHYSQLFIGEASSFLTDQQRLALEGFEAKAIADFRQN